MIGYLRAAVLAAALGAAGAAAAEPAPELKLERIRVQLLYTTSGTLSEDIAPSADFTLTGLSLFAMFYGLDWIATVPPTVRLAAQAWGKRAPMIFGWIFAGHQLGGAVAAYGAGLARTVMASYSPALYAAGAACLLAAVGIFLVRKPAATAAVRV